MNSRLCMKLGLCLGVLLVAGLSMAASHKPWDRITNYCDESLAKVTVHEDGTRTCCLDFGGNGIMCTIGDAGSHKSGDQFAASCADAGGEITTEPDGSQMCCGNLRNGHVGCSFNPAHLRHEGGGSGPEKHTYTDVAPTEWPGPHLSGGGASGPHINSADMQADFTYGNLKAVIVPEQWDKLWQRLETLRANQLNIIRKLNALEREPRRLTFWEYVYDGWLFPCGYFTDAEVEDRAGTFYCLLDYDYAKDAVVINETREIVQIVHVDHGWLAQRQCGGSSIGGQTVGYIPCWYAYAETFGTQKISSEQMLTRFHARP